ncbi:MAG: hypothetical protein WD069_11960 [Planctomycetales bacterium]
MDDPRRFADFLFNSKLYMALETSFGKSVESAFLAQYPLNSPDKWIAAPEKVAKSAELVGLSREEKDRWNGFFANNFPTDGSMSLKNDPRQWGPSKGRATGPPRCVCATRLFARASAGGFSTHAISRAGRTFISRQQGWPFSLTGASGTVVRAAGMFPKRTPRFGG